MSLPISISHPTCLTPGAYNPYIYCYESRVVTKLQNMRLQRVKNCLGWSVPEPKVLGNCVPDNASLRRCFPVRSIHFRYWVFLWSSSEGRGTLAGDAQSKGTSSRERVVQERSFGFTYVGDTSLLQKIKKNLEFHFSPI